MDKNKKISSIAYALVFIFAIFVVGFVSFVNLVDFYVNDRVDYNEWSADLGNKFETDEATAFFKKFQFVNLNGEMRSLLGQREMNGILRLNNGHLIMPQAKMEDEEIEGYADEVIKYADFCKEQGKIFLFVQPILKVDKENKQLPTGVEDYSNENIDVFLKYLKNAGIDILDIRTCMKQDGIDMYDYTYITDHHWTSEGCFYAFGEIVEWIADKTGIKADPDVTDINKYKIITYQGWHLGSYGQRVGQYFAGIDDYDLIIPQFDVSFIDENGEKHSFYEQVVNTEIFENRDVTSRYTYDHALRIPEGIATTSKNMSLLFVTDSYASEMAPYLKLAYSDYCSQYYPDGLNADYVLQSDPDIVVVMPYYTSTFNAGAIFTEAGAN